MTILGIPVHHKLLTKLAVGISNSGFIANMIPRIKKEPEHFSWWEFDNVALNENVNDVRPLGEDSKDALRPKATLQTGQMEAYSLKEKIDDRETDITNPSKFLNDQSATVNTITGQLLIQKEKRAANVFMAAANYATTHKLTLSGTTKWTDYSNSEPKKNIDAGRKIVGLEGQEANTFITNNNNWRDMLGHSDIRVGLKRATNEQTEEDFVPKTLWGMRLWVPGSKSITSLPGVSSETLANIWGNFAWLGYLNPVNSPNKKDASFAYNFENKGRTVDTWREKKRTVVDVQEEIAKLVLTMANSGYLFIDPF